MGDNLVIFGRQYNNVTAIKAYDNNGAIKRFIEPQGTLIVNDNGTADVSQYASAYVNVSTGSGADEITPDYEGLSYGFIDLNNIFYSGKNHSNYISIYSVQRGHKYICCAGDVVNNLLRMQLYYGKTLADFSGYINTPYAGSTDVEAVYTCSKNVTGGIELTFDRLSERFIIVPMEDGILFTMTSNNGRTATSLLMEISSVVPSILADWTTSSDEDVVSAIQAAHAGTINLQTDLGWQIGDVRSIDISSFSVNGISISAQTTGIVISSFSDYNNCGCILQFDFYGALVNGRFQMNARSTNVGGYGATQMKTQNIPALVENGLPSWLRNLLIEFDVLASSGNKLTTIETITGNKLALRSEVEVFGTTTYSAPGEGEYNDYYRRYLKIKQAGNQNINWWLRSPYISGTSQFCYVSQNTPAYFGATNYYYLSPFGCI